jgi:tetratricopeptide (TPR) repeat protein
LEFEFERHNECVLVSSRPLCLKGQNAASGNTTHRNTCAVLVLRKEQMRNGLRLIVTAVAALCAAGCQHTGIGSAPNIAGQQFYESGFRAEEQGNLTLARIHFNQAHEFAQTRRLGPAAEAAALYEWSRITGYLGMTAEAAAGFTNTLSLIDASRGDAEKLRAPALCELARLLHDTKQHARAVPVFEAAINELQKINAPQKDALGFADVLDDYAASLQASGESAVADGVLTRSTAIRIERQTDMVHFRPKRYPPPPLSP